MGITNTEERMCNCPVVTMHSVQYIEMIFSQYFGYNEENFAFFATNFMVKFHSPFYKLYDSEPKLS